MMKRWQIAPLLLILGMGLAHAADPDPNAILGKRKRHKLQRFRPWRNPRKWTRKRMLA